jgi:hypothetical protein
MFIILELEMSAVNYVVFSNNKREREQTLRHARALLAVIDRYCAVGGIDFLNEAAIEAARKNVLEAIMSLEAAIKYVSSLKAAHALLQTRIKEFVEAYKSSYYEAAIALKAPFEAAWQAFRTLENKANLAHKAAEQTGFEALRAGCYGVDFNAPSKAAIEAFEKMKAASAHAVDCDHEAAKARTAAYKVSIDITPAIDRIRAIKDALEAASTAALQAAL